MDNFKSLHSIVNNFPNARVLCLGDVMLDTFNYGHVDRISPERPVPVFKPSDVIHIPGGAANVACNVTALAAKCTLIGLVGCDDASRKLVELLNLKPNLSHNLIYKAECKTTHKIRYLSGNQHIVRIDIEDVPPLPEFSVSYIERLITDLIAIHDVLIISDYAKGFLTAPLISSVIKLANKFRVPIIVDPKGPDLEKYRGASIITPNTAEAELLSNLSIRSDLEAHQAGTFLLESNISDAILITRGSNGMSLIVPNADTIHLASEAIEVFDVVGAGDTVIATLACALATQATMVEASQCANLAAGIVVSKRDTASVSSKELLTRLQRLSNIHLDIIDYQVGSFHDLEKYVSSVKEKNLKIGFTNGVFDILHPGHISLLRYAKQNCDILIVGLNTDSSVKLLNKAPGRPINTDIDRSYVINSLQMVDYTVLFDDPTPIELIKIIKPDILVKGADYIRESIVGFDFVTSYGGQVLLAPIQEGKSTSKIIENVLST